MKKGYVSPAVPAEPYLLKRLRDPRLAAAYLNLAADETDPAAFMQALRRIVEAHGGVARIAERTRLNRQQLYKTLSRQGNPELRTLRAILGAAGFAMSVVPLPRIKRAAKENAESPAASPAALPRAGSGRSPARVRAHRAPPRASRAAA